METKEIYYVLTDEQRIFLNFMVDTHREIIPSVSMGDIEDAVVIGMYTEKQRETLRSLRRIYKVTEIAGGIGERTYSWYKQRYGL